MKPRLVVGISVSIILLLVGIGVFVVPNMDSTVQQVRVYEVPEYTEPQPDVTVVVDTAASVPQSFVSGTTNNSSSDLAVDPMDNAYAAALNPPAPPSGGLIAVVDAPELEDASYEEFEEAMAVTYSHIIRWLRLSLRR